MLFKGSGVALVTPFKEDGSINFEMLKKLIEFHIENNTDAIIVCGTTGESPTLDYEEKKSIYEFCVKCANKRIPIIAGTGTNNTKHAIMLSVAAEKALVDGLLVVTPYYNKTTQEGLIKHYREIASSVSLPIILYNVPSRTGLNIEPNTVYELSKIKNIVGIKEASGNISQILEIMNLVSNDFYVYSGNDGEIIPIMSLGGCGVISVLANTFPKETSDICRLYSEGKIKEARDLQIKFTKYIKSLFSEVNPIPIKEGIKEIGFDCGNPRLPLVNMNNEKKKVLLYEQRRLKN